MARAQFEQKSQKIAGLNTVAAIGQGQSSQAQAGLNTVANQAAQDAQGAAFTNFNRKSANLQLAGTAMGAIAGGVTYGLNNMTPARTTAASSKVLNPPGTNGKLYDNVASGANFASYA